MAEECFKIDGVAIAAPETYKYDLGRTYVD